MNAKIKYYLVPAKEIRAVLEARLEAAQLQLAEAKALTKRREKEIEEEAIPALKREHQALVAKWEALPPEQRRRIRQPTLYENGEFSAIITYKEQTLRTLLDSLLFWGIGDRDRWYEDRWINLRDVYQLRVPDRVYTLRYSDEIGQLKRWLVETYDGEWLEELTESKLHELGLNPNDYQCIRRSAS